MAYCSSTWTKKKGIFKVSLTLLSPVQPLFASKRIGTSRYLPGHFLCLSLESYFVPFLHLMAIV